MKRLTLIVAVALVVVVPPSGGSVESHALVWGKQIGGVKLGMDETTMEYAYGQPVHMVVSRNDTPGKVRSRRRVELRLQGWN